MEKIMPKNKFRADLTINKFRLDDEILQQAQKYYDWAQAASEAEVERDDAKDELDLILIEIEHHIRTNPEDYFDDNQNVTEGAIKSALNNNRKVKKARRKYQKARTNLKLVQKAEKAFEQRKRMIELYLYKMSRMKNSEVRMPHSIEKEFANETRNDIEDSLKPLAGKLRKRRKSKW